MSRDPSPNQRVLANLIALNAINNARAPAIQPPTLLEALGEAINAKVSDLALLAAAGRTTDEQYRDGVAQLSRWRSTWIANR